MEVCGYNLERAANYDEESKVDKGNREQHALYLRDVLAYADIKPRSFLELGCGTAFFTDIFFDLYPGIRGTLVDASQAMLDVAAAKYSGKDVRVELRQGFFETLEWDTFQPSYDIIFSSLSIHHLQDEDKWTLFDSIHRKLSGKGIFILYDIFKPQDPMSVEILEFLACMDSQRRLRLELEVAADMDIEELRIERIIANDRRIKKAEGDKESCLETQKQQLRRSGFRQVTTFFQDTRFAGTIAFKNHPGNRLSI